MSFTEQEAACRRPDVDEALVSELHVVFCIPIGRAGSQRLLTSWVLWGLLGRILCVVQSSILTAALEAQGLTWWCSSPERREFAQGHCC